MLLSKVRVGEPIRFKTNGPVWVRGEYDRSSKTYSVIKFDDMDRESFRKGTTEVLTGFTF